MKKNLPINLTLLNNIKYVRAFSNYVAFSEYLSFALEEAVSSEEKKRKIWHLIENNNIFLIENLLEKNDSFTKLMF